MLVPQIMPRPFVPTYTVPKVRMSPVTQSTPPPHWWAALLIWRPCGAVVRRSEEFGRAAGIGDPVQIQSQVAGACGGLAKAHIICATDSADRSQMRSRGCARVVIEAVPGG